MINRYYLKQTTIENIAKILGETSEGLSGSQIGQYLQELRIADVDTKLTKWIRLYNALLKNHNSIQCSNGVLNFIKHVMDISRYVNNEQLFQYRRCELNKILSFDGYQITEKGGIAKVNAAQTISEARQRADTFKTKLEFRNVSPIIFRYCNPELLAENYFHSVLEAAKSIFDQIRERSNIQEEGAKLIDTVFGGDHPIIIINSYITDSEKSEQRGFANLLKGLYGMFRNPIAHDVKIKWSVNEEDALDIMSIVSYCHKRLDKTHKIVI